MSKKTRKKAQASGSAIADAKPVKLPPADIFEKHLGNKSAWLALGIILLVCCYLFFDFLTFHRLYVFKGIASDSYNQLLPIFVHLSRYLRTDGIPRWSFNVGMGQDIFTEGINSPLSFILILLPWTKIPFFLVYVEIVKFLLGGMFFYGYLRTMRLTRYTAIVGAILFTFSGFMMVGSGWYGYSMTAMYVALLLLAFERLYRYNNLLLFPVAVALISFSVFSVYTYGLFLLIYSLFRFLDENSWDFRKYAALVGKMAALGSIGVLVSGILFIGEAARMIQSPRVSGGEGYYQSLKSVPVFGLENYSTVKFGWGMPYNHLKTAILRLFSSDLMGFGARFRGWYNYLEAPLFSCGLLTLLLIPSVFSALDKRRKILYGAFGGIWVFIVVFPFFRYAFNLFSGDYYKTGISLIVTLVLLFFGLKALDFYDRAEKTNPWYLPASYVGLLFLLYSVNYPDPEVIQDDLRNTLALFITIYAVLLFLMRFPTLKNAMKICILAVVVIECATLWKNNIDNRQTMAPPEFLQEKTGYNDYTVDAVRYLKSIDPGFWRLTKTYFSGTAIHTSFNDAQIQDFYGTRNYASFNQLNYVKFLEETGIISDTLETASRWIIGLRNRPLLQTLCNVKYNLTMWAPEGFYRVGYDSIAQFGNVRVEKNRFSLPFGFTYDKFIRHRDLLEIASKETRRGILSNAFVAEDNDQEAMRGFSAYNLHDTAVINIPGIVNGAPSAVDSMRTDIDSLKKDTLTLQVSRQNYFRGTIALQSRKLLFFSIPYDNGWYAKVNGEKRRLSRVNIGFTGLPLDKGKYTIELFFEPEYLRAGAGLSIIGLLLYAGLVGFVLRRRKTEPPSPSA